MSSLKLTYTVKISTTLLKILFIHFVELSALLTAWLTPSFICIFVMISEEHLHRCLVSHTFAKRGEEEEAMKKEKTSTTILDDM